ncbi:MAG: PrgI family protein [Peptococcaceae bacterium]|nr:PrgI family protein [Peptococcaceae bacterium]
MRQFPVPMNLLEEEKFMGGLLSLRQLVWLCAPLPFIGIVWLFFRLIHVPFWVHILCDAALLAGSCAFAFGRFADMYLDRYAALFILFRWRKRRWVLGGRSK